MFLPPCANFPFPFLSPSAPYWTVPCLCVAWLLQVIELIKRTPKESPPGDYIPDSGTLQGALTLDNVVFSYPIRPSQQILNGLSMAVSPGELLSRVCGLV